MERDLMKQIRVKSLCFSIFTFNLLGIFVYVDNKTYCRLNLVRRYFYRMVNEIIRNFINHKLNVSRIDAV